jgi:hypothetical protein
MKSFGGAWPNPLEGTRTGINHGEVHALGFLPKSEWHLKLVLSGRLLSAIGYMTLFA